MFEGDEEDLWCCCYDRAMELFGYVEGRGFPPRDGGRGRYPAALLNADITKVADEMYDHIKSKTSEDMKKRPKTVPQLRSV